MARGQDIMRLPVVTRDDGKEVGRVEDVIIDRNGTRILGLMVDEKGMFRDARVVAWAGIMVLGLDVVIIDSEKSVAKASDVPEIADVLERGFVLLGSRVETTAGRELGTIENIYFNSQTGVVDGFELIAGRLEKAPSGRAFLPASPSFHSGKDYTFVNPEVADGIIDMRMYLEGQRG